MFFTYHPLYQPIRLPIRFACSHWGHRFMEFLGKTARRRLSRVDGFTAQRGWPCASLR